MNAEARTSCKAAATGVVCNLILAGAKIAVGIMTGLVSLAGDGFNNLSDCGSGAIALLSVHISQKPADREHPYGHQRAEYVASLLIAVLILLLAAGLLCESIGKIISKESPEGGLAVWILLAVSIAVKLGMCLIYRFVFLKSGSAVFKASALDSALDCLATLFVGVGAFLSAQTGAPADGYAGILVSLVILWGGVRILREASSKLLGQAPDRALVEGIKTRLLSGEGVLGIHDLKVYSFGPKKLVATVHVEMDSREPVLLSHAVIDGLERAVGREFGVELTAHYDPVDLDDGEAREAELRIRAAVEGMVEGMELHDFRLVRGEKKKLVFEAGIPFSCKREDGEIENDLCRAVKLLGDYEPVVTVERE